MDIQYRNIFIAHSKVFSQPIWPGIRQRANSCRKSIADNNWYRRSSERRVRSVNQWQITRLPSSIRPANRRQLWELRGMENIILHRPSPPPPPATTPTDKRCPVELMQSINQLLMANASERYLCGYLDRSHKNNDRRNHTAAGMADDAAAMLDWSQSWLDDWASGNFGDSDFQDDKMSQRNIGFNYFSGCEREIDGWK